MTTELEMRPTIFAWLEERGMVTLWESKIFQNADVVGVRFGRRVGRAIPPLELVVVVESKIKDVAGVLSQAECHVGRCTESLVAMPAEHVAKMKPDTLLRFGRKGIGLLAVDAEVRLVIPPRLCQSPLHNIDLRRRLWRRVRNP